MTEAEWLGCADLERMPGWLRRASERKLALFCAAAGWTGGSIDPADRADWHGGAAPAVARRPVPCGSPHARTPFTTSPLTSVSR
jgi:hypothetical protein